MLKPHKILRIILIAIIVGFFCAQADIEESYLPGILLVSGIFLFGAVWLKNKWMGIIFIILISLFFSEQSTILQYSRNKLEIFKNQKITLMGTVDNFPDIRQKDQRLFLKVNTIKTQNKKIEVEDEKILLIIDKDMTIEYGQELEISGKIDIPRNFNGFDYQQYLARYDVHTIMRTNRKKIIIRQKNKGNWLKKHASNFRQIFANNLQKVLPDTNRKISTGILIGVKDEIESRTQNQFRNAGLTHLLVVSGSNVSILVLAISIIFGFLGRRILLPIILLSLVFFVAITGADPPVIRASIMGGIVAISLTIGRFSDPINILLLTAVIMGGFEPSIFRSDVGFLLSFVATLSIVILSPLIKNILQNNCKNNYGHWQDLTSVLCAAQIGVFPLITIYFENYSFWSFPANILAEPLIPFIMIFTLLAVAGSTLLPLTFAKITAIPALLSTEALISIARAFGDLGTTTVPIFVSYLVLILFIGVCLWACFSPKFEDISQEFFAEITH